MRKKILIGVSAAAEIAKTSRTRIYAAIDRGDLHAAPGLPVVLLDKEDVSKWAAENPPKDGRPRKEAVTV